MDLLPFYPGPIGVPPFSPNAPCNRSHLFFLAPALDSEIRCFHHTSLPPTVQLLSDILVSEPNSLPPLARKIIVRRHSSERYGSIAIAIRPSSIELREMKIGMGKKKTKNRIVDRFNPMDTRTWGRDWKKEQGTSQNFFTKVSF